MAGGFWAHGGIWDLIQLPLVGLALLAARIGPMLPGPTRTVARAVGLLALGLGGVLFVPGLRQLGDDLTPFPEPKSGARLVRDGAYGFVRHPIYSGVVLGVFGWALVHHRWAGLLAALVVGLFFDAKARREERRLMARFPEYAAYRRQVCRLVPFLY